MSPGFSVREVAAQCLTYSTEAQLITFDRSVDLRRNPSISIILPKTHETFVNFLEGRHYKERLYFVTEWVVAHGPKNDYPHISLKDTPRWVNKDGIFFCSDLLLFSRNFAKTTSNMANISAPSINTRTSLLKSAKASSHFLRVVKG